MANCVPSAGDELPQQLNLTIYQGGTFNEVITWTDEAGTPINLTGYSAVMKVKTGTITVLSLSVGSGITLGGTLGTITLNVSATDTTDLVAPANCNYDLILTSAGGFAYPLLAGLLNIRAGVSAT